MFLYYFFLQAIFSITDIIIYNIIINDNAENLNNKINKILNVRNMYRVLLLVHLRFLTFSENKGSSATNKPLKTITNNINITRLLKIFAKKVVS